MRNLGVIGALAVMGLLSGVLALPTPRVIYPYPIHRSNGVAFAPTIPQNMDDRQGRLEMIFAAFSRAVDVGFVTAVLRPHEHLVSLLRYYNPKERALYRTISSRHPKRTVSIHPETTDGVASMNQRSPRAELGDPGKFPSHDYRRSEDDTGGNGKSFPVHDYKRSIEPARSSTHSTLGEHLKTRESKDYPPRQPPVHNPQ